MEFRIAGFGFAQVSKIPRYIDLSPYGIKLVLTERAMHSYLRNRGIVEKAWKDDYSGRIVDALPGVLSAAPENLEEGARYQKAHEGVIVIDDLILSVNLEGLARPNDCWRQIKRPREYQHQNM